MRLRTTSLVALAVVLAGSLLAADAVLARGGGGGGSRGGGRGNTARRNVQKAGRDTRKKTEIERERQMRLDHRDSDSARDRTA